jgi:hypothetical protein
MTPEQMREEQELVDRLSAMVAEMTQGLGCGDPAEVWRQRRVEIRRLRVEIRRMRRAHLGH